MNRLEIEECEDIEKIKRLCIAQNEQLTVIGEILVSESKWHITSDEAIRKIRDYLVKHQSDIKLRINEGNEKICDDCIYTDIADWEEIANTGKVKPILWCEKYRHFCSDITDCEYYKEDGDE